MVHILGVNLRDGHVARHALRSFYGIGENVAYRICARLQIHDKCKMKDLTPFQITALTSFLSSPGTSPDLPRYPLAGPNYVPTAGNRSIQDLQNDFQTLRLAKEEKLAAMGRKPKGDPLKNIKIESELRRVIRENIAHQRMIGSYVGKRHAMGLPVRGQNTQSNAKTAKKLNRLERW